MQKHECELVNLLVAGIKQVGWDITHQYSKKWMQKNPFMYYKTTIASNFVKYFFSSFIVFSPAQDVDPIGLKTIHKWTKHHFLGTDYNLTIDCLIHLFSQPTFPCQVTWELLVSLFYSSEVWWTEVNWDWQQCRTFTFWCCSDCINLKVCDQFGE